MTHGTHRAYNHHGCRCTPCRQARSDYLNARQHGITSIDREALADFLRDLLPYGLTDDCPNARTRTTA